MDAGIQQSPVQQGGAGSSVVDVVRVLFEPTAVFERVRERPQVLAPFLAICVVQIILFFVNLPFMKVAIQAQMATGGAPAGTQVPMGMLVGFSLAGIVIAFAVILTLSALILWMLVSIFGGDGKFGTLLSVTCYAAVPAGILLGIIGTIVLHMKGTAGITSPQDMQPALGLDLLMSAKGFVGALLKAINPFSIWGLVLTAIGVSTTHRLSKSTGYTVATIQFLIGVLIAASLAAIFGGRAG